MGRDSVSAFSKTVRFQFIGISVLFLLAFSTFYLAWGQMRYSTTTIIPMEKFVYWRFAMAGWLPLVGYLVTCLFVVNVMLSVASSKTRSLRLISGLHQGACGVALLWCLLFCAWEITAWTECNDIGPKHPECRNREYPAKTIADYSFIMMVIAGGVMAAAMAWALYFNSMVGINRTALQLSAQASLVGDHYGESKTKGRKYDREHHHTKQHARYIDMGNIGFIGGQGEQ